MMSDAVDIVSGFFPENSKKMSETAIEIAERLEKSAEYSALKTLICSERKQEKEDKDNG